MDIVHVYLCLVIVRLSRKCSASGRCGECSGCKQPNCGTCPECLDMRCFGGPGVRKKACKGRKCTGSYTQPSSAIDVAKTVSKLSSLVHGVGKNDVACMHG